jgi:hypothetical protein
LPRTTLPALISAPAVNVPMVDGAALLTAVPTWNRYLSVAGLASTYSSSDSPILPIVMPYVAVAHCGRAKSDTSLSTNARLARRTASTISVPRRVLLIA